MVTPLMAELWALLTWTAPRTETTTWPSALLPLLLSWLIMVQWVLCPTFRSATESVCGGGEQATRAGQWDQEHQAALQVAFCETIAIAATTFNPTL